MVYISSFPFTNMDDPSYDDVINSKQFSFKTSPQNEFEHADMLINSDLETEIEIQYNMSKIIDKHMQLVNIGEPMMRLYQIDSNLLTHMASIARRDQDNFGMVFSVLYFGWRGELLLTKALKGDERKMQGTVKSKFNPELNKGGYGSSLEMDEEEANLLSKILNRGKD